MAMASRAILWRYNYKILMGGGYWVIVLPIAASQVVTLWMMALSHDFSDAIGLQIAELMTPILGAFLVAHSLAPEYRSGIGSVLACKPISLWRLVTIRVGLALLSAVLLTWITLTVCSVGLSQIEVGPPIYASLPSLWFLSMLALTLATFFRSAIAGFAAAASLWAMDVGFGFAANPALSLQGLSAKGEALPLSELWPYGKALLAVLGTVLLLWHGRLLSRLGRSADQADLTRVVLSVAAMVVAYLVSGAVLSVLFGYYNRAVLPQRDVTWLRGRLAFYGPVPAARLFGPAFAAYVSKAALASSESESPGASRVEQLEHALKRWPTSMWADSIAFDLAIERTMIDPVAGAADYFNVADSYGSSPFAPRALEAVITSEAPDVPEEDRLRAARRLIADYPRSAETDRAAGYLDANSPGTVPAEEVLRAALVAAEGSIPPLRPHWMARAAQLQLQQGDRETARASARRAIELAEAQLQGDFEDIHSSRLGRYRTPIAKSVAVAEAVLDQTGGR